MNNYLRLDLPDEIYTRFLKRYRSRDKPGSTGNFILFHHSALNVTRDAEEVTSDE